MKTKYLHAAFRIFALMVCLLLLGNIAAAQPGQALDFDGGDDVVVVSSDSTLNPDTGCLTVEAWFRWDDNPPYLRAFIVSKYGLGGNDGGAGGREWDLYNLRLENGNVLFGTRDSGIGYPDPDRDTDRAVSPLTYYDYQWHHAAGVRDAASMRMLLYVDGALVANEPMTRAGDVSPTNMLTIGARETYLNDTFSWMFSGQIDEVRIWAVARTEAEIQANMNGEISGSQAGLVAYYKFNHGIACGNNAGVTTLIDYSGYSNDGILLNFALNGYTSNWVAESGLPPTKSPEELLLDLAFDVVDMNLQNGISNSLDAKLDAALQALEDINQNNDVAAINSLRSFINAVEAQRGNKIPEADADDLIDAANEIITKLGG
jgi:hypothetical protein